MDDQPQPESPKIAWCGKCGTKILWPDDMSPWPTECPKGCKPFLVTSWDPKAVRAA